MLGCIAYLDESTETETKWRHDALDPVAMLLVSYFEIAEECRVVK